jgi:histidine triad (HIT) family protein
VSDGRASCIFCRIVDRAAEASYVAEEEDVVAFMDVRPINEGHALVVPREHQAALADVPDPTAVALWSLARRVAAALRESGLRCEGINLFVADGEAAGQEVPHAHLHVMPRWQGDGFGFRFPERYRDTPPRKALDEAAARIRARL